MSIRCALPAFLFVACMGDAGAQAAAERRNWFNDPFFQVSVALANCPVPAGPFITDEEKRVQAHHRAERGTTCWLSGQCDRPNDYAYDADIAQALKAALRSRPAVLKNNTLWVTVQGRVVFIEGCARRAGVDSQIEAIARSIPNVRQAVAAVYAGPPAHVPYRLLDGQTGKADPPLKRNRASRPAG